MRKGWIGISPFQPSSAFKKLLLRTVLTAFFWNEINRAIGFEMHHSGPKGKQGVVISAPDIEARLEPCPSLTEDNRPDIDALACIDLDPQHLWVGVTSV